MIEKQFKNEKEFQIYLGKLIAEGFKVYTDKKICELPTFHGCMDKPDLLVYRNNDWKDIEKKSDCVSISNPFFIETKVGGFNNSTKAVLQLRKYFDKQYYIEDKDSPFTVQTFLLTNPSMIFKGLIYPWSAATYQYKNCDQKSFWDGIHWASIRFISSLAERKPGSQFKKQFCGFLIGIDNKLALQFPNHSLFYLDSGFIKNKRDIQDGDPKTTTEF